MISLEFNMFEVWLEFSVLKYSLKCIILPLLITIFFGAKVNVLYNFQKYYIIRIETRLGHNPILIQLNWYDIKTNSYVWSDNK